MHNCITTIIIIWEWNSKTEVFVVPCNEHENHSKDVCLYSILHRSNSTIRPRTIERLMLQKFVRFCCLLLDCKDYFLGSVRRGQRKTLKYNSYQNVVKIFIVIALRIYIEVLWWKVNITLPKIYAFPASK